MGLNEYITSSYLKKEVTDNYNELKIKLSELDADYRVAVEEADSNVILTSNPILKYLSTFGIDVLVISDNTSEKAYKDCPQPHQHELLLLHQQALWLHPPCSHRSRATCRSRCT